MSWGSETQLVIKTNTYDKTIVENFRSLQQYNIYSSVGGIIFLGLLCFLLIHQLIALVTTEEVISPQKDLTGWLIGVTYKCRYTGTLDN